MIRKTLIAATLFVAACAAPYDLPAGDHTAIAARISTFERAFSKGDAAEVIRVVPPRMMSTIAAKRGIPVQDLRRGMIRLTKQATAKVKVVSFGMALDQAKFLTTPSGRPYGLIPTQTVIQTPRGITLQSNTNTLTMEEGGKWYLLRIDDENQIDLMREVYPDFKGVSFPKGTSKVIG